MTGSVTWPRDASLARSMSVCVCPVSLTLFVFVFGRRPPIVFEQFPGRLAHGDAVTLDVQRPNRADQVDVVVHGTVSRSGSTMVGAAGSGADSAASNASARLLRPGFCPAS